MQDVYKNIEDYDPRKKHKVLVVSDDMIADMIIGKKLLSVVTELFIRGGKFNIPLALLCNHIIKYLKMLDETLRTIFLIKSQIKENFNKLKLISRHILTLGIL